MTHPRILLFGPAGQVGWELRRTHAPQGELTCDGRPEVDFTRPDSLRTVIATTKPAIIVNAAAHTAVDKAETEGALAAAVNTDAPGLMAAEAKKLGALLVHFSTDYVFDGSKTSPYVETDPTGPLGANARTKIAGEQAVAASGCAHLIFRLCWVYGSRGANFMLTMQRLAREREKLRVVADQVGCPTSSRLIAETTALALARAASPEQAGALSGIYHLCASGHTSWHGFASAIIAAMPEAERKCREIEAIPTSAYPTPARRPAYSVMSCGKLQDTFGLRLPDWKHGLDLVLEK